MKIVPVVSVSVLAGAILLSAFACAPTANKDNQPTNSPSASATPARTPTASANPSAPSTGNGTPSDPVSVNPPVNLDISEITTNSFKASWDAPSNTVGKITKYSVLVIEDGVTKDSYYTTDTNYTVPGTSNNAYMVKVRAFAVSDSGLKEATSIPAASRTIVVFSPPIPDNPTAPESSAPVASSPVIPSATPVATATPTVPPSAAPTVSPVLAPSTAPTVTPSASPVVPGK